MFFFSLLLEYKFHYREDTQALVTLQFSIVIHFRVSDNRVQRRFKTC